jgi:hypothetical protein
MKYLTTRNEFVKVYTFAQEIKLKVCQQTVLQIIAVTYTIL